MLLAVWACILGAIRKGLALARGTGDVWAFDIASCEGPDAHRWHRQLFKVTVMNCFADISMIVSTVEAIDRQVRETCPRLPCRIERCGIRVDFRAMYRPTGAGETMFHRAALLEGAKSTCRRG